MDNQKQLNCNICSLNQGKYTCPKCNLLYCSIECYRNTQKHLKCSEDFYKNEISEHLKELKIDSKEDKHRIVDILKRVNNDGNMLEENSSDDESNSGSDLIENIDLNDEFTRTKIAKFYENELKKWKPWWIIKEALVKEPQNNETLFQINKNLLKNIEKLTVPEKALQNEFIFGDMIQIFYVYVALVYVYQRNLANEADLLDSEFCFNFIDLENRVLDRNLQVNHQTRLRIIIQKINESDTCLKEYLNSEFLIKIIDDLIQIIQDRVKMLKSLSHLHEILWNCVHVKDENHEFLNNDNKTINVFHINKQKKEHTPLNTDNSINQRKSRVQIITKKTCSNSSRIIEEKGGNITNESKNVIKLLLKRIEFYYKWLIRKPDYKIDCQMFNIIKTNLEKEQNEFSETQKCLDQNLDKIRQVVQKTSTNLIEELN